jgi:hypothetical protein
MMDVDTVWFWAFLASFLYIVYKEYNKPEISIKKALKYLKKHLIRLIVFYQSHYSASDQISLIAQWLDNIDEKEVPEWQKNGLKNKILDKFKEKSLN